MFRSRCLAKIELTIIIIMIMISPKFDLGLSPETSIPGYVPGMRSMHGRSMPTRNPCSAPGQKCVEVLLSRVDVVARGIVGVPQQWFIVTQIYYQHLDVGSIHANVHYSIALVRPTIATQRSPCSASQVWTDRTLFMQPRQSDT